MTLNKLSEKLIILAMLLIGFQYFAISLYTSTYDISSFLLLLAALLATKKRKLFSITLIIVISAFFLIEIVKYLSFQYAPIYRVFSGLFWIGGLLLILAKKDFIYYSQKKIFIAILMGLFVTCSFMLFQYFADTAWPIGRNTSVNRPLGLFDEPSYAGLVLYSASSALFGVAVLSRTNFKLKLFNAILGSVIFIFGLMTLSMHIVTFFITLSIILLIYLSISSSGILKILTAIFFIGIFSLIAIFILLENSHYLVRFDLTINSSTDLSVLAWIRGFDQAFHAFQMAPIFGFGLGSTGGFEMNSLSQDVLESHNLGGLTKLDGYSMFFRLVVELGFAVVSIFLIYLLVQLKNFRSLLLNKNYINYDFNYCIFIFIFSFTLIVGILIKEPTYARSYVYASIFLFSTILPVVRKEKEIKGLLVL